jgi:hypothetical protein
MYSSCIHIVAPVCVLRLRSACCVYHTEAGPAHRQYRQQHVALLLLLLLLLLKVLCLGRAGLLPSRSVVGAGLLCICG